jgi:hypothetical protein
MLGMERDRGRMGGKGLASGDSGVEDGKGILWRNGTGDGWLLDVWLR